MLLFLFGLRYQVPTSRQSKILEETLFMSQIYQHVNDWALDESTWIIIIFGFFLIGTLGLEYVGLIKETWGLNVFSCVFRFFYFVLLIIYLGWFGYTFLYLKIGAENEKKASSLRLKIVFIHFFKYIHPNLDLVNESVRSLLFTKSSIFTKSRGLS